MKAGPYSAERLERRSPAFGRFYSLHEAQSWCGGTSLQWEELNVRPGQRMLVGTNAKGFVRAVVRGPADNAMPARSGHMNL